MNAVVSTPNGQLGTIVSWRVPSEVPFNQLKLALTGAGMDPDLALELEPTNALTRALGEMRKGRIIRKHRRDGEWLYFQLTKEFLEEQEIRYEKEAEVGIKTKTGELVCPEPEILAAAQALMSAHLEKRLTSDLTRLLKRFYDSFSADLIPIREQGGAYFVPDQHRDLVTKTRTLLQAIGGNLRSFDVRLGSDDTSASVAESMTEYLQQLVADFRASCEDVDGSSRADVKERRRGSVAELRQKLELYRGLLSGYASHIDGEIKTAEEELLRKLATGGKDNRPPTE